MKISCIPVVLFPQIIAGGMSLGSWARMASEIGLDGIDLSTLFLRNHTPVYLVSVVKELEAEGMAVVMIAAYPDFSHPDRTQRERELEYLRGDIALASQIGARYLRILAGQAHPETQVQEGIGWVAENFKQAAATAERFHVQLVYENHSKPSSWFLSDFSHPTQVFLEIAERIRDTGIGLNFDTANVIAYGDDPRDLLGQIVDRVVTVHAADTSTRGKLTLTALGTGRVPFNELFSVLKRHGFDNWISLEDGSKDAREGLARARTFVRRVWDEA